jgi:hypothetical protein
VARVLAALVLLTALALPRVADSTSAAKDQEPAKAADVETSKKDLLRKMNALEAKLPRELARQLVIISIKIATGWCSPYLAKEFETELGKLPEQERKDFEKEWKAVREHEAWPTVIVNKQAGSSSPKK